MPSMCAVTASLVEVHRSVAEPYAVDVSVHIEHEAALANDANESEEINTDAAINAESDFGVENMRVIVIVVGPI